MAKVRCPLCGRRTGVPIFRGYPTPDSMDGVLEASRRGELHLGGCLVTGDDPDWHCRSCGHEWKDESAGATHQDVG